ncbi:fumarylacetoacetate hydrolase [Parahaliea maris]|uniref:Fumarylacetoacetate hydrolase n=1 Tax=Parahaliea maris TaxID=2716870 RepID=A0A5C8ZTQ4_9GAMM|nr:fumarylacetoacetate hydrolase family protein [Parahaliea maris]TXS91878.1 fumarylacetoacetate hydrolase [Parahaliea maris]
MKLATLKCDQANGCPVLVSQDQQRAIRIDHLAPSVLSAIANWREVESELQALYKQLNTAEVESSFAFDPEQAMAPLPRTWQWLDGSLFLSHGELMQLAFNLEPIEGADTIPLIYQGAGDDLRGPRADLEVTTEEHGIDFEGEFAVVVDEVPMGTPADKALDYVRLVMIANDVSLRALAPREMRTGFGFVQAKPSTAFSPVAVTPDELGAAWKDGRVHLDLEIEWNGRWFGNPNGGEMHFGFHELIAHAALTRRLSAGTILGSGTVSTRDRSRGSACISERRAIDIIESGEVKTPFMKFGDRVRMTARLADGDAVFGEIDQQVTQYKVADA